MHRSWQSVHCSFKFTLSMNYFDCCLQAFDALRILSEQMHMQHCSSSAVTDGIKIDVTSACIGVGVHCSLCCPL